MHPFRLVVLGGTGFAVLAMLLPFASFPVVGSVDGVTADAWPALIPLLVAAVIALTGRSSQGFGAVAGVTTVTAGALALLFSLVKMTDAILAVRDTAGASLGPGGWVLSAAALVVTAGATIGALVRT